MRDAEIVVQALDVGDDDRLGVEQGFAAGDRARPRPGCARSARDRHASAPRRGRSWNTVDVNGAPVR